MLIFSQLIEMLDLLEYLLGPTGLKLPFVRLDGSTPVAERQRMIDKFQAAGSKVFAFLLSTRAGGQGINLTGADTVILHDLDWNPMLDRQAEDRSHRIGQTRPVSIYRLVTAGSVEESILAMQQRKKVLGDTVLDGAAAASSSAASAAAAEEEGQLKDGGGEEDLEVVGETKLDSTMMSMIIQHALGLAKGQVEV